MATFNVVVSDPETGRSFTREVDGQDANRFMGREIGEEVDGTAVDLDGFTLEITGGSDDAGRPMRPDVRGPALTEILLTGGTGFRPTRDGERKRVTVRGREVSDSISQLNVSVIEGEGSVPVALGEEEPAEVEPEPEETSDEETGEEPEEEELEDEEAEDETDEEAGEDVDDEESETGEDEESEADEDGESETDEDEASESEEMDEESETEGETDDEATDSEDEE